jgi:hypothetical protein
LSPFPVAKYKYKYKYPSFNNPSVNHLFRSPPISLSTKESDPWSVVKKAYEGQSVKAKVYNHDLLFERITGPVSTASGHLLVGSMINLFLFSSDNKRYLFFINQDPSGKISRIFVHGKEAENATLLPSSQYPDLDHLIKKSKDLHSWAREHPKEKPEFVKLFASLVTIAAECLRENGNCPTTPAFLFQQTAGNRRKIQRNPLRGKQWDLAKKAFCKGRATQDGLYGFRRVDLHIIKKRDDLYTGNCMVTDPEESNFSVQTDFEIRTSTQKPLEQVATNSSGILKFNNLFLYPGAFPKENSDDFLHYPDQIDALFQQKGHLEWYEVTFSLISILSSWIKNQSNVC